MKSEGLSMQKNKGTNADVIRGSGGNMNWHHVGLLKRKAKPDILDLGALERSKKNSRLLCSMAMVFFLIERTSILQRCFIFFVNQFHQLIYLLAHAVTNR